MQHQEQQNLRAEFELEQQSEKWLEERKSRIGSSDIPIILGISPYKTPYQLWEQKVGLAPPQAENYATAKGHNLERIAAEHYTLKTGIETKPKVFRIFPEMINEGFFPMVY